MEHESSSATGRGSPWTRALVVVALCVFLAAALYGIAAPFSFGHYGFHGGEYSTRARHTLRHGSFLPGNVPGMSPPTPSSYYLHHPVLTHHFVTATFAILGDHEYSVRAGSILAALSGFLLLVLLLRRHFGPWHAVLGAWVFALCPINVWYSAHMDPALPSIAALLLFFVGYLGWLESGRWRSAALALLGMSLAGGFEWSPYLAAVPIGLHVLWTGLHRRGRYLAFVPLFVLAVLLPIGLHFLVVSRMGQMADFFGSYHARTSASGYRAFLGHMKEYGLTLFGWPLVVVTAVWTLGQTVRLVAGKAKARDLIGWSFLFALVVYGHLFQQAVITHAYRQLYGNVACTIAAVDVVAAVAFVLGALAGQSRARVHIVAVAAGLGGLAIVAGTARPAWSGLIESRAHGGIPGWTHFDPDLPKVALGQAVRDMTSPTDVLHIHPTFSYRMETNFYLDRDARKLPALKVIEGMPAADKARAVVILVPSQLAADERLTLARLARMHPVTQIDRYLVLDLRSTAPAVRVDRLAPVPVEQRTWMSRYLVGPYAPLQRVRDGQREVELMVEFGVAPRGPNVPDIALPSAENTAALLTFHNYYTLRKDAARVTAARRRLLDGASVRVSDMEPDGDAQVLGFTWAPNGALRTFVLAKKVQPPPLQLYLQTIASADGKVARFDHLFRPLSTEWIEGFVYVDTASVALLSGRYEFSAALGPPPVSGAIPTLARHGAVKPSLAPPPVAPMPAIVLKGVLARP